tara:strand:+ start:99 stop:209 length:111 start_codon:yes stop_codon:yes gene_type:complete
LLEAVAVQIVVTAVAAELEDIEVLQIMHLHQEYNIQ